MTKQEQHDLRVKIAKHLKQVQASLTFMADEDLEILEADLKKQLKKLLD